MPHTSVPKAKEGIFLYLIFFFFLNAAVGREEIGMHSSRVVYNQCLLAPKAAWLSRM